MPNHAAFNWKFHRIGGLDQVTLRTPEELLHLNELDPKLWVALSCPIDKLQFDARTLELLDADKDGAHPRSRGSRRRSLDCGPPQRSGAAGRKPSGVGP